MIDSLRDRIGVEPRSSLPPVDLDADDLHHALSCERRRIMIDFVNELSDGVSFSDLTEFVAAEQLGKGVEDLTSTERKRVYVSLYQTHAPKLDKLGVIEFTERCEVYPTEKTAPIAEIARTVDEAAGGESA